MSTALLSDLGTEIVIPICAVIGIAFALVQWLIVSRVKLTSDHNAPTGANNNKSGFSDSLIEEEEGLNDHGVVSKCAEIQTAISEECWSFGFCLFDERKRRKWKE